MHLSDITKKVIICELLGFGSVICLIWINEIFDIPHRLLGAAPTPINLRESVLETAMVLALAVFIVSLTSRLLKRVKYLEGILPICSYCKKIRMENRWVPVEEYVGDHSEASFSHGLCPECCEKYYGDDFLDAIKMDDDE